MLFVSRVKKDLVGKRFGKLLVLDKYRTNNERKTQWLCLCECGNKKYIYRHSLTKGLSKSCGCSLKTQSGLSNTRVYRIWWGIKERCYNHNHTHYHRYGGRGIRICQEWLDDFMNFYNWAMENGYSDDLSIDRIDNDGDYEPSNCRWITKSKNTAIANKINHRRKTKHMYYGISPEGNYYEFSNGSKFAREHGLKGSLLRDMAHGRKYKNSTYNGWKFGFTNKINK